MKTLIVYYTLEGNTHYAAKKIASKLGADVLRIKPVKTYPRKGFKKFFWGGKSAVMAETPELEPYEFDASAYDRIIFGFPVWAGNVTPPIRTFIKDNELSGKRIAAFACQSGSGAEKAFGKLKAALGIEKLEAELVLIDPRVKPDPMNDEKIKGFCEKLDLKEDKPMSKALVAYFSASGVTGKVAENLASAIGADIYEIKPVQKYSKADLNWMDKKSRSSVEMNDRLSRPAIENKVDQMSDYDVVFVGFPIWWYREPSIIDTFMEAYDFSGKTIVPFATSGGSGLGDSAANMQALAKGSKVVEGKRFGRNASASELRSWAEKYI